MDAVRMQIIVASDGTLTIKGLPALAGRKVDVLIRESAQEATRASLYPLRGKPVDYREPFEGVAEKDWGALE